MFSSTEKYRPAWASTTAAAPTTSRRRLHRRNSTAMAQPTALITEGPKPPRYRVSGQGEDWDLAPDPERSMAVPPPDSWAETTEELSSLMDRRPSWPVLPGCEIDVAGGGGLSRDKNCPQPPQYRSTGRFPNPQRWQRRASLGGVQLPAQVVRRHRTLHGKRCGSRWRQWIRLPPRTGVSPPPRRPFGQ